MTAQTGSCPHAERSFELAPFGSEHILEAAQLADGAFEQGAFPGWADIQIAATAVLTGSEIVRADPDGFEAVSCEVWDYRGEVRSPAERQA